MRMFRGVSGATLLIGAVVLACHIAYGLSLVYLLADWPDRAGFGEMFGGLNTYFAGAAFGGILYTLVIQQREWRDQAQAIQKQGELLQLTARLEVATALLRMYEDEERNAAYDRKQDIYRRKSELFSELTDLYERARQSDRP
jgi:hypothetical protein